MWHQIFLITLMFVFSSCSNKMSITEYNNINVELRINATAKIVYDTININVCFENNTSTDIYLLRRENVTISENRAYVWNFEILFQDTILMVSPFNFLSKIKTPTKKDYFILSSGEMYNLNFSVDFSKLVKNPIDFGNINNDYGEYSLKLTYKDPFVIDQRAFRGEIESNVIKLLYKK